MERLQPYLDRLDLVLVMSVFAGFGGQRFLPDVLAKVEQLRDMGFEGEVSMDGGIGPETIAASAAAGTNVFVAGTAVFSVADRRERIAALRRSAERARADTPPR